MFGGLEELFDIKKLKGPVREESRVMYRLCCKRAASIGRAKYVMTNGRVDLQEVFKADMKKFLVYLACSDGTVDREEARYISELLGKNMPDYVVRDYAEQWDLWSEHIKDAPPLSLEPFVRSNVGGETGEISDSYYDLITLYVTTFNYIGNDLISCNEELKQCEIEALSSYVMMLRENICEIQQRMEDFVPSVEYKSGSKPILMGETVMDYGQKGDAARRDFALKTSKPEENEINLSPIMMPCERRTYQFPNLIRTSFNGVPGLVADSLPDKFGNAVINNWLMKQGRQPDSVGVVERLCYTGERGMGALEYRPQLGPSLAAAQRVDVDELVNLASSILRQRKEFIVKPEKDEDLNMLLKLGTSAGGARAKAIIAWNPDTNEIRSGKIKAGDGFAYNPEGNYTSKHQMTINGKLAHFTKDDFIDAGRNMGITKAKAEKIIWRVSENIKNWSMYAETAGVPEYKMELIKRTYPNID